MDLRRFIIWRNVPWKGPFEGDYILRRSCEDLVRTYGIGCVIETGTYMGATTTALAACAPRVISIELSRTLWLIARIRFCMNRTVTLLCGASPHVLRRILPSFSGGERLLLFLDAHWHEPNPLRDELSAIAECGVQPALMIHDVRVPDHPELGYDRYPAQGITYDLAYVQDLLDAMYGGREAYDCFYNQEAAGARRGCLFAVPRAWGTRP